MENERTFSQDEVLDLFEKFSYTLLKNNLNNYRDNSNKIYNFMKTIKYNYSSDDFPGLAFYEGVDRTIKDLPELEESFFRGLDCNFIDSLNILFKDFLKTEV